MLCSSHLPGHIFKCLHKEYDIIICLRICKYSEDALSHYASISEMECLCLYNFSSCVIQIHCIHGEKYKISTDRLQNLIHDRILFLTTA